MNQPLRYQISRWPQAVDCLSNNSRNLRINVNEILNADSLTGTLIQVNHSAMGTLFAAMVDGTGELVNTTDYDGNLLPWMTTKEIIVQLKKFGFELVYNEISSLNDETLNCLMQVRDLQFDKITKLTVVSRQNGARVVTPVVVAIQSDKNDDLLTFGVQITANKFGRRASEGSILNLTDREPNINWGWLDSIYNISDLLADNADIEGTTFQPAEDVDPEDVPEVTPDDIPTLLVPEGFTLYDDNEVEDDGNEPE